MSRSIYRAVPIESVEGEYAAAAEAPEDFRRAKWGSHESMVNRFRLALSLAGWSEVRRWLDVGCGPGTFFRHVEGEGHAFDALVGVDLAEPMLAAASEARYRSPVRFVRADLMTLPEDLADFDLVTAIGVLQQCGYPPDRTLPVLLERTRAGGQLFLTTKNSAWAEFSRGKLTPYSGHSWFEYEDLVAPLRRSGASIVASGGFLPRENRRVPLDESHTMFILARRNG